MRYVEQEIKNLDFKLPFGNSRPTIHHLVLLPTRDSLQTILIVARQHPFFSSSKNIWLFYTMYCEYNKFVKEKINNLFEKIEITFLQWKKLFACENSSVIIMISELSIPKEKWKKIILPENIDCYFSTYTVIPIE